MTGVDMYWHRVPATALKAAPRELWESVPTFGDDAYPVAVAEGVVLAVAEDYLLLEVLFAGSTGMAADPAGLIVSGGDWRPIGAGADDEVGVLTAQQVEAVSVYLADAEPSEWIAQRSLELAAVLRQYSPHPWSDQRASHLAQDAVELVDFYHRAAEAGEAVVKILVA
ncbi:hypothetical protein Cs7R123_72350 [Catellatospora sp. TT07R-123]|uniref:DUF1877 family protein n=1 Tax=Catellatospora sp. TT07R-123 TaxID=2733863 RepID=UPI001B050435|nr:DUF1877 family protein [Catellatospora sp. TT07R-123]GHJ49893.1 hypothetical protein Cs7R123_72350 [Catellatospora sp. TT07R-123]